MASGNSRVARRVLVEIFDEGRVEAIEELVNPDFINHEAPEGTPQGREAFKQTVTWLRGLWGPMHADVEDEISEGDKVVLRVTMHGRHVGEFLGRAPTGREYAAQQIHVYRIRDGQMVEHWACRDDLSVALQLGLIGG